MSAAVAIIPVAVTVVQQFEIQLGRNGRLLMAVLTVMPGVVTLGFALKKVVGTYASDWGPRRQAVAVLSGMLAFGLLVISVVTQRDPFAALPRLTGTQDVASLGFIRPDGSSSRDLADTSAEVARELGAQMPESAVVSYAELIDPPLESLGEGGLARLDDWTADFAQKTGADFVIAGVVDDSSSGQVRVRPAVYVSPALVPEAPELAGWSVGEWAVVVGDLSSRRGRERLQTAYLSDSVELARFVDALDAWRAGNVVEARELLDQVEAASDVGILPQDLVQLFRGHAQQLEALRFGVSDRNALLDQAAGHYASVANDSSIALRARLSLATNTYLRSTGTVCRDDVDVDGLARARDELEALTREVAEPPLLRLATLLNYAQAQRCALTAGLSEDVGTLEETLDEIAMAQVPEEEAAAASIRAIQAVALSVQAEMANERGDTTLALSLMQQAIDLTGDFVDRGRWWGFVSVWSRQGCAIEAARDALEASIAQYEAAADAGRIPEGFVEHYTETTQSDLARAVEECDPT